MIRKIRTGGDKSFFNEQETKEFDFIGFYHMTH